MSVATAILLFSIVCHVYSTNTGDQNSCNTCCSSPAGIPGIPGTHGNPGPKGDNGAKGEIGAIGEKGEKGETGRDGAPGKYGPIGQKGDVGQKGNVGQKGYKGTVGSAGSPGRKGEPGPLNTMIFKSAFSVKSAGYKSGDLDQTQPIKYNTVITNIGGDYNLTAGKFVCRVPGAYVFSFTVHNVHNMNLAVTIMKNNMRTVSSHSMTKSATSTSTTVVLELVDDDKVWTQVYGSSYDNIYWNSFAEASFSGFLLYPA